MDRNKILNEINEAVKNVTTVSTMGDSVLAVDKFDEFVRQMQDEANILEEARFMEMNSHKVDIDRIAFLDRVLEKGVENEASDKVAPSTYTNQLVANELMAIVGLTDQTVRRNIERENLEDTLIELLGEAAGRDMEEFGIFASENFDADEYNDGEGWSPIDLTDGWIKKAENKLWEDAFDDSDEDYPETVFQSMLEALPKKYLQNRADWRFYVPWDVEDEYRNLLKERGTQLGDAIQIGHDDVFFKGIPIVYAPMLERYDAKTIMLQNPDNMVWGVFHEVAIEMEREAKKRRTDFVLTFEGDCHYEDEDAVVVAIDADDEDDSENGETGEHPLN